MNIKVTNQELNHLITLLEKDKQDFVLLNYLRKQGALPIKNVGNGKRVRCPSGATGVVYQSLSENYKVIAYDDYSCYVCNDDMMVQEIE